MLLLITLFISNPALAISGGPKHYLDDAIKAPGKIETPKSVIKEEVKKETPISSDKMEVIEYIKYVWKDEDYDTILRVAKCESGYKTDVVSRTSDVGVMQINLAAHWDKIKGNTREEKIESLKDYKYNIDLGKKIYDASKKRTGNGFLPWVCYTLKIY